MSLSNGNQSTPPGWYADPAGSPQLRWWDGTQWTEHLQGAAAPAAPAAPVAQPAYPGQAAHPAQPAHPGYPSYPAAPAYVGATATIPSVPDGTPVYGPLIWVITLLPLLSILLLPLSLADLEPMMRNAAADPYGYSPYAGMSTAGLAGQAISTVLSWALAAAMIVLSYFDHRWLRRQGFVRPFHWAWSLFALTGLGAFVYPIGRSVVVRRRSGRGIAPMWVSIAVAVVSVITSIAVVSWIFSVMFSTIGSTTGSFT